MARLIDAEWLDQFKAGVGIPRDDWPTIAESDSWDEWMKGGTWVAREGEDFTGSAEEFGNEVWRRGEAANLFAEVETRPQPRQAGGRVVFQFHHLLTQEGKVLDFSKPAPVHDAETGEYLGYWFMPGGWRIPLPDGWSPRWTDDAA
ncbi:hypothetical protein [Streptomyces sp. NPDC051286]|uniref:hypothetical protein n=1 Tax=Streptomyces sp. NPDC051286 TaxID=3365647 RepID=UPI0037BB071E